MKENIITILMLLGILAILQICNIVFGIVLGSQKKKFNIKKLSKGVLKAILFCLAFIGFCFCIEILPNILLRIDIKISDNLITLIEIMGITLTAYKKYAIDCYEKIKIFLNVESEEDK
jgi:hypothetical protein